MLERSYLVLSAPDTRRPAALGSSRGARAQRLPKSVSIKELRLEDAQLSGAARADLERDPRVQAVVESMPVTLIEPVRRAASSAAESPAAQAWGIAAVGATQSTFDGRGVVVAVLDTGIAADHPAFAKVELEQMNFTQEAADDLDGHGTHVAGTIFGADVGARRIGIARGIRRALIGKVLGKGGGSSQTIAKAMQWAIGRGANVLSMSLGIDFPGYVQGLVEHDGMPVNAATSLALDAYRANVDLFTRLAALIEAQAAFGSGCIVIAASGNESERPTYEIAVAPPAAATGILAVGAVGDGPQGLRVADFSNSRVDLAAPGVDIISASPAGGFASMSGTSMATPHVAGVAALWAQKRLQADQIVKPEVLRANLIATARKDAFAPGHAGLSDVGNGIVQAPQA